MIIAFAHHKGGTGKTTSCISVAGCLAKKNKKVLVVDMDPQGNATSGLGIEKKGLRKSMYDVMSKKMDVMKVILETELNNIHLAPATMALMETNTKVYKSKDDALILNKALREVKEYYDYVLIDTPPSHGHFIVNAALAADEVILILDPGIFSLEGIVPLQTAFETYSRKAGKKIKVGSILLTKHKTSWLGFGKNPSKEVGNELKELYKDVFFVPYSDVVYESHIEGKPLSHHKPWSKINRAYEKITERILENDSD